MATTPQRARITEPAPAPPPLDTDPRGFRALPPFVDVVYGAVLGFGVFQMSEATRLDATVKRGRWTPLFLLIVTTIHLVFGYAQARMCTEKNYYTGLTRYVLDMFIAIAFVFAYVQAYRASPYYLLALSSLLALRALWIWSLHKEHPNLKLHLTFMNFTHYSAAGALIALLVARKVGIFAAAWTRVINVVAGSLFLLYSLLLSLLTLKMTELERGLLPIIPFYGSIRAIKEILGIHDLPPEN